MKTTKTHRRRSGKRGMASAEWNAKFPIGTPVNYWPGTRGDDIPPRTGTTRSEAWDICGHASVMCTGYSGGIALTHVEPIEQPTAKAS